MESLGLAHFDYLVIGIIALSGLIAFFRGFVQETLSLLLWIVAFAAAMFFNVYLDPYFIDTLKVLRSEGFLQSSLSLLASFF